MNDKIYPSMVIRSQAEAIKLLEKENKELKEKIILLQASEPMLELTKYYGEKDELQQENKELHNKIEKLENELFLYKQLR